MVRFKGADVEQDMILTGARWYAAYPLSDRQVEQDHRGVKRSTRPLSQRSPTGWGHLPPAACAAAPGPV